MNKLLLLALFMSLMIVSIQTAPTNVTENEKNDDFALYSRISWGCTGSCTMWNTCRLFNMLNLDKCGPQPNGCVCTSFAWEN